MKIKISILKPRNRLVALALSRKAGAHRDRTTFARGRKLPRDKGVDTDEVQSLREAGLL